MSTHRTVYSDAQSTQEMCADCLEVEHNLHLVSTVGGLPVRSPDSDASAASRLHSHYDVSDDLARRAGGLELHFD